MYGWMVLNFHLYGWTQFSARFLNDHADVPYQEFYGRLFEYVKSSDVPLINQQFLRTKERIETYMTRGEIQGNLKDEIGLELEIAGHNLMWLSQMCFRTQGGAVFEELKPFLRSFGDQLDPQLLSDLMSAQEHSIVFYEETYPKKLSLNSNLVEAVLAEANLESGVPHHYTVDYRTEIRAIRPDVDTMSMTDFLYMLYYKRRQTPGTTSMIQTNSPGAVEAVTAKRLS